MRKYPHPRSIKSIKSLAQFRGVSSGYNYAEAFVLGRKDEFDISGRCIGRNWKWSFLQVFKSC